MDVTSIAKNSAVKEISKYIPKKKDNRAMFQFNSGTPAHVKAAIAHNQLIAHFNIQKCEPMRDGDKIKWVYLKQNPYGLDGLGFKGYEDPDEIMDLVKTYIDYDKIFEIFQVLAKNNSNINPIKNIVICCYLVFVHFDKRYSCFCKNKNQSIGFLILQASFKFIINPS